MCGDHNSPGHAELPILYAATWIVVPRGTKFHVAGSTVVREGRLQPGIETLGQGRKVMFVVELRVFESHWMGESKAGDEQEATLTLHSP